MTEFNTAVTAEQSAFLLANREELYKTDGGKAIWQNRVKMAGEAFKIAKTAYDESTVQSLDITSDEDEADDIDPECPVWATYRDNFILDWIANRTVVTEEEADMIFERDVNDALSVIEASEQDDEIVVEPGTEVTSEAAGLPPEAEVIVLVPSLVEVPAEQAVARQKRERPVVKAKTKSPLKRVAAKKAGKSTSERAQEIIAWGQSRDWSRKDILARLTTQIDGLGSAYAATLYQKHAS